MSTSFWSEETAVPCCLNKFYSYFLLRSGFLIVFNAVSFRYFCENNNRQTVKKDYTILIKIEIENKLKWSERLQNPLGMKVVEYSIETGGNDPLDFNLGYNLSGM